MDRRIDPDEIMPIWIKGDILRLGKEKDSGMLSNFTMSRIKEGDTVEVMGVVKKADGTYRVLGFVSAAITRKVKYVIRYGRVTELEEFEKINFEDKISLFTYEFFPSELSASA